MAAEPRKPVVLAEVEAGELERLRTGSDELDRVLGGGLVPGSVVLIGGSPGIGKSSVVNELHKALLTPRGLFVSGKFDQGKRGIPYASIAQAFQSPR